MQNTIIDVDFRHVNRGDKIQNIQHDGIMTMTAAPNRKSKVWTQSDIRWSQFVRRVSNTTTTEETAEEYAAMTKPERDEAKDVGVFIAGEMKDKEIISRTAITMEIDTEGDDLINRIDHIIPYAYVLYSTHDHTEERTGLQLVIPLRRPVTADEYEAISRKIAIILDIEAFAEHSYRPEAATFFPSTPKDASYVFKFHDGAWLKPEDALNSYKDWNDTTQWPTSVRGAKEIRQKIKKAGEPGEKTGYVGAFNRVYSVPEAIAAFLPHIYTENGETFDMVGRDVRGGLSIHEDNKFAYSIYANDPAGGKALNAFDLVRVHLFGEQDKDAITGTPVGRMPSTTAMLHFAQEITEVKKENVKGMMNETEENAFVEYSEDDYGDSCIPSVEPPEDMDDMEEIPTDDWVGELETHPRTGAILPSGPNFQKIIQNDIGLKGCIAFNLFTNSTVIRGELPWSKGRVGDKWSDEDHSALRIYIENKYKISNDKKLIDAIRTARFNNAFHPVREYLDGLEWDGTERLDSLLVRYFDADDDAYTRAVTRKWFTAAVKRIYRPGSKFDYMLVLVGAQGIGKSKFFRYMTKDGQWFNDSISSIHGKDAKELLQGSWIVELAEMTASKRSENEAMKQFISTQVDKYRKAYGMESGEFKRQCVFAGTTNETEFLKDRTGNRRYWAITVGDTPVFSIERQLRDEVDQIWAEAKMRYENGEETYLDHSMEDMARSVQARHTEINPLVGMIEEYLERDIPQNWYTTTIDDRQHYNRFGNFKNTQKGSLMQRDRICAAEIWCEVLGNDNPATMRTIDAKNIKDALQEIPGWKQSKSNLSFGASALGMTYGKQRCFVRTGGRDDR